MRFAIVDLANLWARCLHVTRGDAFTRSGMSLHVVLRSLRKLHKDMHIDHVVFCVEGRSWRYQVYPQYKAKRKMDRLAKSPKDREEEEIFFSVLNDFVKYLSEKTRCTVLQSDGVEGDDFVARWVQLHPDDEHVILSGDSDFVQLVAPNCLIYDAIGERTITSDGVFDTKGNRMEFSINPGDGKIKTIGKAPPEWVPENDWIKKALFVKIIRGDSGDGIFSAFPGVRYNGSSKKVGICEAWDDRHAGGYCWNNFFLQSWDKLMEDGSTKQVRVLDEFEVNEMLIDLSKQPEDVVKLMDTVILQAVQKEPVSNVGIHFMKFCKQQSLDRLSSEAKDHAAYLGAPYIQDQAAA